MLSDSPKQLYIIALGINDYASLHNKKGTISDIHLDDYTQNADTFYGNYGRILSQLKSHAPNAKIIISKIFIPTNSGGYYNWSSVAIEQIANLFNIPFIDTMNSELMKSDEYNNDIDTHKGHPTAPMYVGIASEMRKLVADCIYRNIGYFNDYYPL